jgi:hypothetical protein
VRLGCQVSQSEGWQSLEVAREGCRCLLRAGGMTPGKMRLELKKEVCRSEPGGSTHLACLVQDEGSEKTPVPKWLSVWGGHVWACK